MKIVDIIKYEGDNRTFVWKHPSEDFNTLSQLIVHESQEALLFLDGQALDLFGPGKHTLHTKNIPLLRRIVNIPTDGESPFHCEVYFINKTEQMAIEWGMGGVNFLDPTHNNYAFKIGASGEMSLQINDSRKIITKLVGTENILDRETLKRYFKAPITTHIKTILPNILREKCTSIFEVEAYLSEFSDIIKQRVSEEMDDYGVFLSKFWINTILKPENDPFYQTLNRQRGEKVTLVNQGELDLTRADYDRQVGIVGHTGEIQKRRMDIETKKFEQEELGFTYQQDRGFDVMEKIAENEGSGSDLRNAAMGIGIGFGAGGAFGNAITNIANNTSLSSLTDSDKPIQGNTAGDEGIPGMINLKEDKSRDKDDGGMDSFKNKVEKLKTMQEAGALTEEEFNAIKKQLLDQIIGGK